MSEVKFIRAGRYVSPNGDDLGPVKAPAEAQTQSESPSTQQPSGNQTPDDGDRTVEELKAALDKAGVQYPSSAKKADLLKLATEKGV